MELYRLSYNCPCRFVFMRYKQKGSGINFYPISILSGFLSEIKRLDIGFEPDIFPYYSTTQYNLPGSTLSYYKNKKVLKLHTKNPVGDFFTMPNRGNSIFINSEKEIKSRHGRATRVFRIFDIVDRSCPFHRHHLPHPFLYSHHRFFALPPG